MNFYFLVEGNDEALIYPQWLAHLRPELQRVWEFDKATKNNYYLFTAGGYPDILDEDLPHAIANANLVGNYDCLVVCFDADEDDIMEREKQVAAVLQANPLSLPTQIKIVIQNRCLETWLLGNRAIYPDNPKNNELKEFLAYYNAAINDPELMGNPEKIYKHYYRRHGRFHKRYFQVLLDEYGIKKSERLTEASKPTYLDQLLARLGATPTHLKTLKTFINFCQEIN